MAHPTKDSVSRARQHPKVSPPVPDDGWKDGKAKARALPPRPFFRTRGKGDTESDSPELLEDSPFFTGKTVSFRRPFGYNPTLEYVGSHRLVA